MLTTTCSFSCPRSRQRTTSNNSNGKLQLLKRSCSKISLNGVRPQSTVNKKPSKTGAVSSSSGNTSKNRSSSSSSAGLAMHTSGKRVPIVLQTLDGKKTLRVRLRSSATLGKAFDLFSSKLGYPSGVLRFTLQGFSVSSNLTAQEIGKKAHAPLTKRTSLPMPIKIVAVVYHE